jgi:hypothetical protein
MNLMNLMNLIDEQQSAAVVQNSYTAMPIFLLLHVLRRAPTDRWAAPTVAALARDGV